MSIFINAYKRRSTDHVITVYDAQGEVVPFDVGDVFRVKVGRPKGTPLIDIRSGGSGNSSVTASNPTTFRIHQEDLVNAIPGAYEVDAAIVDASDGNRIKHADQGVLVLHDTLTGDTGAT